MADETPRLKLPFMSTAQVQKELTFNELAAMVDTLLHLNIIDKDLTVAPGSPDEGDTYIVATGATGIWAGKDDYLAFYVGGWHYLMPQDGWIGWVGDESTYYRYKTADAWQPTLLTPAEYLGELTDVNVGIPGSGENGYALRWDNGTSKFTLQPVAFAGLSDVNMTGITDGQVPVWDTGTSKFIPGDRDGAFTDLSDTPAAYTGNANKIIAVKATEDGLEFVDDAGGLSDAPSDGDTYGRKDGAWEVVTGGGLSDAPSDGETYGRKDGTWEVVTGGGGGGGYGTTRASGRYWGLFGVSAESTAVVAAAIEFADTTAGSAITVTSAVASSGVAAYAFDSDGDTNWDAGTTDKAWITGDLGSSYELAEMRIQSRVDYGGGATQVPIKFMLRCSDDRQVWRDVMYVDMPSPITSLGTFTTITIPPLDNIVGGVAEGSGFPVAPGDGDRFWRADRGLEYYWDDANSNWLSSQQFVLEFNTGLASIANNVNVRVAHPHAYDGYSMWVESASIQHIKDSGSGDRTITLNGYVEATTTATAYGSGVVLSAADSLWHTTTAAMGVEVPPTMDVMYISSGGVGATMFLSIKYLYRLIG